MPPIIGVSRRSVLAAAEEPMREIGYHNVTMDRIAARSGVAKMTLYRWWPDKAAVVTDAVRDSLAPASTPDTGAVVTDCLTQLCALVDVLTRYGDASVTAAAMSARGEAGRADLRDILHPWEESLIEILSRGALSTRFPIRATAHAWMGYIVYRTVFLEEEITADDLSVLVNIPL
ncbi:TetR/AcrR family transcriptional regulator [Catenuloplanes japonicus]|uniref:TetR/AcrR family transcriptional regulator n=1 Tax=Catenuloplanes japonicus TaxID=33876 RepID=UPI00068E120A|nr:TetR/AcrR family transcriptional regulator [Catenuloplanes japonicus]